MIGPPIWRVGTPLSAVSIDDGLMPCVNHQPIYIALPGITDMFLPVFSSENKLREYMILSKASYETIVQVNDTLEFLDSIREAREKGQPIRIMHDPFLTERGTTRFKEVLL